MTVDRGAMPAGDSVAVCIPTYRRVPQLARLLAALGRQRGVEPFAILIGNNDSSDLRSAPELNRPELPAYRVIAVATRGVSAVRNAMITDLLAGPTTPAWIACLDDDQEPDADWLASLILVGRATDADLVGGPVTRTAPRDSFWSHGAADTSYLPTRDGPIDMLNEAGNLLMRTAYLGSLTREPFALDFGRTGGEDYEFFLHARSRHARLAWAANARVSEALPDDSVSLRRFAWRFYSIAAYQARADRLYRGVGYVIRTIGVLLLKGPVVALRSLVLDRSPRRAIGVLVQYAAMTAGRLVGLAGARAERYGADK